MHFYLKVQIIEICNNSRSSFSECRGQMPGSGLDNAVYSPSHHFMSRPLRIEYPGTFYHVISRGIAREAYYWDDDDRTAFSTVLCEVIVQHGWQCHVYCLMDNHYHLLIEIPNGNLARGMLWPQDQFE